VLTCMLYCNVILVKWSQHDIAIQHCNVILVKWSSGVDQAQGQQVLTKQGAA